jgi:magnesium chelatase family protein
MLVRRLSTLLPDLTLAEDIQTMHIHDDAALTSRHHTVIATLSWRASHHTISDVGLIGGGQVLKVMRQPLEERMVIIARASLVTSPLISLTLPAHL